MGSNRTTVEALAQTRAALDMRHWLGVATLLAEFGSPESNAEAPAFYWAEAAWSRLGTCARDVALYFALRPEAQVGVAHTEIAKAIGGSGRVRTGVAALVAKGGLVVEPLTARTSRYTLHVALRAAALRYHAPIAAPGLNTGALEDVLRRRRRLTATIETLRAEIRKLDDALGVNV